MFEELGIDKKDFLKNYWRKKPFVIRGGGELFVHKIDKNNFLDIAEKLKDVVTGTANYAGEDVIFCEDISSIDPLLKNRANVNGQKLGVWHECWFDGSYSKKYHGIGRHFDDSDNFVIQQEGKRLWVLGSPGLVTEEERKSRIKHESNSGVCNSFNQEGACVVLEPGDVLYLPIFFPHWGISIEDSVSITFAVQSINPLYSLFPLLREILSNDSDWWNPIPAHASDVLSNEYLNRLGKALKDPSLSAKISSLWYERLKYSNSWINDEELSFTNHLDYQPNDFSDIDWNPSIGIEEFTLDTNRAAVKLSTEKINEIFKNAKEQNLNEFIKTVESHFKEQEV
ncbi:cupin domain-containing protein [Cytobacillus oceanisediminis]|uniref:cupin domain-containing protein n=1 Tax=Cytobacillus oceanisediminis TaxID=665099 RepID=UPI00204077D4|nr:cupin domain-containing protein [Cytobacillus oceanisediminis]MCM3393140.1 cupin domain-containing protein [Cytobacillus oceanisediminis]